jgi:hypothetical protein
MSDSYNLYLWLKVIEAKLDNVLAILEGTDPSRLTAIRQQVEDKTAELKAALDAQTPPKV